MLKKVGLPALEEKDSSQAADLLATSLGLSVDYDEEIIY